MTKSITVKQAIDEAKAMTAEEFETKYEDNIEWLVVDNTLDLNEGMYQINVRCDDGTVEIEFLDGKFKAAPRVHPY